MSLFSRRLNFTLPAGQSAFLWGARKTGKSTWLRQHYPNSIYYDFLKTDVMLELTRHPSALREQLLAKDLSILRGPLILDEVQKVPQILDEVQWLIETQKLSFILCGSSARKLKHGQANLLGGRAWRFEMHPLVFAEIPGFDLLQALNRGLLPSHYVERQFRRSLRAYVQDYLKEEVLAEGLTRNIAAFSRFFDAVGYSHGELINYANIARDSGVDAKTIKEYYQILVDTLLGTFVEPFKRRQSRQVISATPKFYLFDVGVAGVLTRRQIPEARGEQFGKAFEHFIFMELHAHRSYSELDYAINFWRTKSGLEVDFVLADGELALEVKGAGSVANKELKALAAFAEEFKPKHALLICNEKEERLIGKVRVIPWKTFLTRLWAGEYLK
jgi:predicted AAA+ superfamily ATPase